MKTFAIIGWLVVAAVLIGGSFFLAKAVEQGREDSDAYNRFKEACYAKHHRLGRDPYVVGNLCVRGDNIVLRYIP